MKSQSISFSINAKPMTFQVDPRQSLLDLLRMHGFASVKEGCGVGECGACTILVDELPVDSCLYLALWADGRSIRTTEGEAREGKLSQVQQAYLDAGAVQCGFCTPGLIMTSTAFLEKNKGNEKISRHDIRRAHAGNLCRCTGYEGIIRAVEQCLAENEKGDQDPASACACNLPDEPNT